MTKNKWFWLGFCAVGLVAVGLWFLKERSVSFSSSAVAVSQSPGGGQLVQDKADGYSFNMPANWYLEPGRTDGVAVYPDYDPSSGASPTCKIEMTAFPANGQDLNSWLGDYLQRDPTASVSQTSLSGLTVSGQDAIEWQGTLNSVTTTLVYVSANGKIFEIAPSTLSSTSDADNDDCDDALGEFLSILQL